MRACMRVCGKEGREKERISFYKKINEPICTNLEKDIYLIYQFYLVSKYNKSFKKRKS